MIWPHDVSVMLGTLYVFIHWQALPERIVQLLKNKSKTVKNIHYIIGALKDELVSPKRTLRILFGIGHDCYNTHKDYRIK